MVREMKDSGIAWIGEIPREWEVVPFKKQYSLGKGLSITKADLVEKGVPVISYGQIHSKDNIGTAIKDELIRFVPNDFLNNNSEALVNKGDIIFADTSEDFDGCGNCVYVDRDCILFAGYHTIIARNKEKKATSYFAYLFKTDCWRWQIRSVVNGVKLFSVPQKKLSTTTIIVPPLSEQHLISSYLDAKCSEIDSALSLQEQMISELRAYKQSLITETVTHGLNPNAKMKNSGVEWIGEIPEKWEVVPFKKQYSLGKGLSITKADLVEEGLPVISYGQIHSKDNIGTAIKNELIRYVPYNFLENNSEAIVHKGDLIFADTSEDFEGCGNCVYIDRDCTLFAGYHTIIAHNKEKEATSYFSYLFKTDCWRWQIRSVVNGVKLFSIPQKKLSATTIILPPLSEQQAIASFLDEKCAEIDALIVLREKKMEALKEYKKSLIYECVTGKKTSCLICKPKKRTSSKT